MVDYVRKMTVKKSYKYGKIGSFEHFLFLFVLFVCLSDCCSMDPTLMFSDKCVCCSNRVCSRNLKGERYLFLHKSCITLYVH